MRYQNDIHDWIKHTTVFAITIAGLLLTVNVYGQTQTDLEFRRQQLIIEIKETNKKLNKTRKDKETALDHYLTLQNQIKKRRLLIDNLQSEMLLIDEKLVQTNENIENLEKEETRLKEEYAQMARLAYRYKLSHNTLFFIFSANSVNEAFQRWRYLKQYDQFREKQARLIKETQSLLLKEKEVLELDKVEKQNLLTTQEKQKVNMESELKVKNRVLKNLKSSEAKLLTDLEKRQKAHAELNRAIENIIRKAMLAKRKEARKPGALNSEKPSASSVYLTGDFLNNKGNLPWPVRKGKITRPFGKQTHPTLKTITISNNGIDIGTENRAEVKAVFKGKVVGIQFVPGYQNMIIIQHGNFYTVYSNLEDVFVQRNETISAGKTIGRLGSRKAEVHFEVWKEKIRLNPVEWLKR